MTGTWDPNSYNDPNNPYHTAAGLAQFLPNTWQGFAEKEGTYLNRLCREKGYLNEKGKVNKSKYQEIQDLRLDPRVTIITLAEFTTENLAAAKAHNLITEGMSTQQVADMAYTMHHEGQGGGIAFYKDAQRVAAGESLGPAGEMDTNVYRKKFFLQFRKHLNYRAGETTVQLAERQAASDAATYADIDARAKVEGSYHLAYHKWFAGYKTGHINVSMFQEKPH